MPKNKELQKSLLDGANLQLNTTIANVPMEYTGWRDEAQAAEKSAYLGTALMDTSPIYDVSGPDVAEFFNRFFVNKFSKLKVGGIRHGILCNEKGQIMTDGVVMKINDDTFRTYWLSPCLQFLVEKYGKDYDISGKDISGSETFFQIAGPEAYNIMIEAVGYDKKLDDLKFAHHDMFKIAGKDVRILRMGMTGNLAYEVHGAMDDGADVYNAIWAAGKPKGMRKIGQQTYMMSHTPGGMPNILDHYPMPWFESEDGVYAGFSEFLAGMPQYAVYNYNRDLLGSVGDDLESRFVTPFDTGWGNMIKFTHEFPGKEALQELKDHPEKQRHVVTLEWNADDVADVYKSWLQGRDGVVYDPIDDRPVDVYFNFPHEGYVYHADKVLINDKQIGISSMRTLSPYYKHMISLAFIDGDYAKEGNELVVLWGNPGHPQKKIRAKVSYYPYVSQDQEDNRTAAVGAKN